MTNQRKDKDLRKQIKRLYLNGFNFAEIGRKLEPQRSRERVRQIVNGMNIRKDINRVGVLDIKL